MLSHIARHYAAEAVDIAVVLKVASSLVVEAVEARKQLLILAPNGHVDPGVVESTLLCAPVLQNVRHQQHPGCSGTIRRSCWLAHVGSVVGRSSVGCLSFKGS